MYKLSPSDFTNFIKDVDKLLSGPLPNEDQNCKWCAYRHVGEKYSQV